MTDSGVEDIDRQALELLMSRGQPRRRARQRVARPLIDAEEARIALPSGELAAWRLGEGPAVLLVHGWEDDNALWGPAIEAFRQWARPVVAIDLPGHGFSTADDLSMRAVGEALNAVADQLGPIDAVVGHSFGCAALIYALGHGLEADKAVMIATPVPRTRPRRPLSAEFEGVDPAVLARAEEMRQSHAREQSGKVEAQIAALSTPCLAIHSIDDEQCPLANSQKLVELWPGAELMMVDALGHRFLAQDADVIDRVVRFVEDA